MSDPSNPQQPLETYEESEINHILERFILAVRKEDGDYYSTKSLYQKIASIQRHLLQVTDGKKGHILAKNDTIYRGTRQVLENELQRLAKLGYGQTNQANSLSVIQEKKLLDLCDPNTPDGLLNRNIIHIHKGLSLRGGAGARLSIHDIVPTARRIYETGGPYCPYADIEKYILKRPKPDTTPKYFLQVRSNTKDEKVWYKNQVMSYKNGLRATLPTRMYEAGIPEKDILDQTGHRSLSGVRKYMRPSDNHKRAIVAKTSIEVEPTTIEDSEKYYEEVNKAKKNLEEYAQLHEKEEEELKKEEIQKMGDEHEADEARDKFSEFKISGNSSCTINVYIGRKRKL